MTEGERDIVIDVADSYSERGRDKIVFIVARAPISCNNPTNVLGRSDCWNNQSVATT